MGKLKICDIVLKKKYIILEFCNLTYIERRFFLLDKTKIEEKKISSSLEAQ